jgi:CelD/BcsL family acetyltransferase involved in cellulose biosynthesis
MQSSSPHAVANAHDIIWVNQQPCLPIALPSTWEAYLARLGRKMRQNLSYYDRLLQRTFEVVEKRLAEQPELPEAMSALFELHQKRWQRRQQCGHLGSQQVQAFHRQIAERFYERDWLRLHDLRVGGRIVAIEYAFCFRERYATYLTGFDPDPEWQRYSIGTVTSAEAVRQAIAEGCQMIDFLRGKDAYKMLWASTEGVPARPATCNCTKPRHGFHRFHPRSRRAGGQQPRSCILVRGETYAREAPFRK